MFTLVHNYRAILLENQAPEFHSLWKLAVLGLFLFLAGHAWFYKLRKSFPDML
jgi:ABC-type polysaccharide/polyol phosphate export permease